MGRRFVVCVHSGAGFHSQRKEDAFLSLMSNACLAAQRAVEDGEGATEDGRAVWAVVMAVMSLEDSPHTNAGVGSNLTLSGTVSLSPS